MIYPSDGPRPTASSGERKLYAALKAHLPEGWRAWHSLRLWGAGYRESEGDFVIGIPRRGMLIVEVKGGRIELTGGRWLQNGRELEVAPRQQAQGFARALVGAIQARDSKPPPWEIVCGFPDVEFSAGPTAGDVAGLVIGERDLEWLGKSLPLLADRALANRPVPANDSWMDAIHSLWGETWVPRVGLADRVDDAERRSIALDADQVAILDVVGENRRVLVEGGAGTGETVIARELLARNARANKRGLYFCFTDALALAVDRGLELEGGASARPRAVAIRRYAQELLGTAGHSASQTREFWNEVSLRAACDALPPEDQRPDLVVIDEAQDFEPSDWLLVEALVGDRALWAFADPHQQFWTDRVAPAQPFANATRLRLAQQHRNPSDLASFALRYLDESAPSKKPDSSVLRVSVARDGDVLARVRHELDTLRRDGADREDIAILTLAGRDKSQLMSTDTLGSHRLVRADDPSAPKSIIADTFLRFKGLDRPFVIVTELMQGATMRYATRMHIALTRATVGAIVVCDEAAVERDLRLKALIA